MKGQYTDEEMKAMTNSLDSISPERDHIVRLRGKTVNYYYQNDDGSWTNYHCRTKS